MAKPRGKGMSGHPWNTTTFNGLGYQAHPFNTTTCDHEIGRKVIGGFPGHEHAHTMGPQVCLKCGKTLGELITPPTPMSEIEAVIEKNLNVLRACLEHWQEEQENEEDKQSNNYYLCEENIAIYEGKIEVLTDLLAELKGGEK